MGLLGLGTLLALFLAEGVLHLVPFRLNDYHSTVSFVPDSDLGYRPTPDQDAVNNLACLRVPHVKTNRLGLRGGDWREAPGSGIAVLGDSFLFAVTTSERYHLASRLESLSGRAVWNAGVSGYGTYQELLIWRKLLKERRPAVTVLFLYLENDIRDNQCDLARAENQKYSPCLQVSGGQVVERTDFEVRPRASGGTSWLKDNCETCRVARNLLRPAPTLPKDFFVHESFAYNVYRPGLSSRWDDAWRATEWALRTLKEETDAAGSRLLVVNVPGVIQTSADWRAEIASQIGPAPIPPGFDIDSPIRRLTAITEAAHIDLLDLQPAFLAYRDQHHLKAPVFGWCCDGHWNPLGHRLAADLVYERLRASGWIEGAPVAPTPGPRDVMGAPLMDQVYSCATVTLGS